MPESGGALTGVANKLLCLLPGGKSVEMEEFPVTFTHIGRKGFSITFFAESVVEQRQWLDVVSKHLDAMNARDVVVNDRNAIFIAKSLGDGVFAAQDVRCVVPYGE